MKNRERFAWALSGLLVTTMLLGGGYQATNYRNGDVNGDGGIDIADPIYLLAYLFEGGPEPVTIRGLVPATGQVECWNDGIPSTVIPCDSVDFPGQDGAYQHGASLVGRLVDNGDGTITDQLTGLMWHAGILQVGDWQTSLQYCEDLVFAGHDDWRMPNDREMFSVTWRSPLSNSWSLDLGYFVPQFSGGGNVYAWTSTIASTTARRVVGIFSAYGTSAREPTGFIQDTATLVVPVRGPVE